MKSGQQQGNAPWLSNVFLRADISDLVFQPLKSTSISGNNLPDWFGGFFSHFQAFDCY